MIIEKCKGCGTEIEKREVFQGKGYTVYPSGKCRECVLLELMSKETINGNKADPGH